MNLNKTTNTMCKEGRYIYKKRKGEIQRNKQDRLNPKAYISVLIPKVEYETQKITA